MKHQHSFGSEPLRPSYHRTDATPRPATAIRLVIMSCTSSPPPPAFFKCPPVDYTYATVSRPPILKRMNVPQRSWQPHKLGRKPTKSVVSEDLLPLPRISFDLVGAQRPYGIPVSLLTSNGCKRSVPSMVQNSQDPVFEGLDRLTFRLIWPGYEHVELSRQIRLSTPTGQITRGQLAEQIIEHLINFFCRLSQETVNQSVNPSTKVWMIGHSPGQWSMDNIILLGLYPVHGNTFQADLQLFFPHQAKADQGPRR
ncbi:hypothetical protein EIP91_006821 [Steccherinum ochraceum]|uniref:Uncharacterized protein n=1 Tax=Steccherinum ochraceum TaxID=92696 RepID=A0A4R0R7S5_9APHY|nr:hypothetical protein EIP91_006821 [Steccherinum ochraceum]